MDRCGTAEGHLVVFDRTEGGSCGEKVFRRDEAEGLPRPGEQLPALSLRVILTDYQMIVRIN